MDAGEIFKKVFTGQRLMKIALFMTDEVVMPFAEELVKESDNKLDDAALPIIKEFLRAAIGKIGPAMQAA